MANPFKRLIESAFKVKIVPIPKAINQLPISNKSAIDDIEELQAGESYKGAIDMAAIDECRTLSENREYMYKAYDDMKQDTIISAALELYADDATQPDNEGRIIWVDSDDPDIAKAGNRLLRALDVGSNAWSHIYALCQYGDLYLETFRADPYNNELHDIVTKSQADLDLHRSNNKVFSHLEERVQAIYNPAEIFDLTHGGKTVGFFRLPYKSKSDTVNTFDYKVKNSELYDPTKYVHILLSQATSRNPERISISYDNNDEDADEFSDNDYIVKRGKSILHDIYKIHQELSLMEDSLLLNRVTRSAIIRLLQIEVGDLPKSEVSRLLMRVKNLMEQHAVMDKSSGEYRSTPNPGPVDNIIYIPTRNGKGVVSSSTIGGDVDVKSIADLDYFRNKEFGGLKIPKQFLGYNDESGLGAGQSLAKISSRYARTVRRIQSAYISGITLLLNLFFIDKKLDYVNKFVVKMVSPSTTEDAERDESFSSKIDTINKLLDKISEIYNDEYPDLSKDVLEHLLSTFAGQSSLVDIILKSKSKTEEEKEKEESNQNEESQDTDLGNDFNSELPDEDSLSSEINSETNPDDENRSGNAGDFGSTSSGSGFGNFANSAE